MKKTLMFLSMALGLAAAAPTFAQDRHMYEAPPVRTEVVVRPEYGPGHARMDDRRYERAELRREWQHRARFAASVHARKLEEQARRERHFAATGRVSRAY